MSALCPSVPETGVTLRSILFVPADRPERFEKAAESGADAIILDLEDSVSPENKAAARAHVGEWLQRQERCCTLVRVNPLQGGMTGDDLAAVVPFGADGIVLPKAEGAASLHELDRLDPQIAGIPVLPIATETPAAVFELGTYREVPDRLLALSWGAEDLPAAMGASASRNADRSYTAPYEVVRSLALFAAHAAGCLALDTVYPDIGDIDGLAAYAQRARGDGFDGMLAIHPTQVPVINAAFTPSAEELDRARKVVEAFASHPGHGALKVDGQMLDAPHLKAAKRILNL